MAVRIIGGRLGGRVLKVPGGLAVRPTPDRVRESVFAALGDVWEGRRLLDAFAGSGCVSFEALSRGAAHATLVERDARVQRALRDNAAALGLADAVTVLRGDATRVVRRLARDGQRFDAAWLDPPYASDLLPRTLEALVVGHLLAPDAVVVAEHPTRTPPPDTVAGVATGEGGGPALTLVDRRRYGDTSVTIYRNRAVAPEPKGRTERERDA